MSEAVAWPSATGTKYCELGYWTGELLQSLLARQVAARPDRTALCSGDVSLSFAAVDTLSTQLARHLIMRGVRPGDRALVQLPNGADFYIVFWALLKSGIKPVFALFSHNAHELEAFSEQLQPELLIVSRAHKLFGTDQYINSTLGKLSPVRVILFAGDDSADYGLTAAMQATPAAPAHMDLAEVSAKLRADDVAFFQLSGGSTSTPKLIPRTHNDYLYSVRRSAEICRLGPQSVYLCALPAAHNFPMSSPGALGVWYGGGRVVMAADPSPPTCFPLIAQHQVNITALVPPMVPLWLAAAAKQTGQLASLRLLQVGGARLAESLAARIEPELGCRLQQVFGMAEGLVCYTRWDDDDWHRWHTQGRPMSEADEIKIVDDAGQAVAPDQPGHLLTRGPYTVRGYYQAPEHNRQAFDSDGFYKTGDIVQRTAGGHLIVIGRQKDQINRGGEKIAAAEVENLLLGYPGVLQAALIALPDVDLGERSCAALVCAGALPKPHLVRQYLRGLGIADFKMPDRFVQIAAMPLTAVGKPDKRRLRQDLSPTDAPGGALWRSAP